MNKKGQLGMGFAGLAAAAVGVVILVILMIGVAVPITTNVINNQAFTGVNLTIAQNLVTFILLSVLVVIAGLAIAGFAMGRK